MIVGVPKEIKVREYRVGLAPASVRELTERGHTVLVEASAGVGIGVSDADYVLAGAEVVTTADEVFARSEMIVKVKEPQLHECARLRPGQLLFTYLHLAPDPEQARALMASGATCVAYETVTSAAGGLPLLAPMSEVAGRMAIQAITIQDQRYRDYSKSVDFIQRYIFPGGFLPSITAMNELMTRHTDFVVRNLFDMGPDYARTLAHWRQRFTHAWQDIEKLGFDERFRRMWLYYFGYCEAGFNARTISVVQLTAERV